MFNRWNPVFGSTLPPPPLCSLHADCEQGVCKMCIAPSVSQFKQVGVPHMGFISSGTMTTKIFCFVLLIKVTSLWSWDFKHISTKYSSFVCVNLGGYVCQPRDWNRGEKMVFVLFWLWPFAWFTHMSCVTAKLSNAGFFSRRRMH